MSVVFASEGTAGLFAYPLDHFGCAPPAEGEAAGFVVFEIYLREISVSPAYTLGLRRSGGGRGEVRGRGMREKTYEREFLEQLALVRPRQSLLPRDFTCLFSFPNKPIHNQHHQHCLLAQQTEREESIGKEAYTPVIVPQDIPFRPSRLRRPIIDRPIMSCELLFALESGEAVEVGSEVAWDGRG